MLVLIPAYRPGPGLPDLVANLHDADPALAVVIVDDGSGPAFDAVFEEARARGADLIRHQVNRGKGHALRAGFAHAAHRYRGQGVVCADADGQHCVVDILRVAARLRERPDALVLGVRRFSRAAGATVPARSRIGNGVTRAVFRAVTGCDVRDTQTGLRAVPAPLLARLGAISGDRYEYELRVLLDAAGAGIAIEEVEIATIYLDDNSASHFRPVRDSLRVYAPLLAFAASSLASSVVDIVMLLALNLATGSLLGSVIGARLASAGVNFALNRRVVFRHGRDVPLRLAIVKYAVVAVGLLGASYACLRVLTGIGLPLATAKITGDLALFLVNFAVQHRVVFAPRREHRHGPGRRDRPGNAHEGDPSTGTAATPTSRVVEAGTGIGTRRRGSTGPSTAHG